MIAKGQNKKLQIAIVAAFCALLILCVVLDISILVALIIGLGLFLGYGRYCGFGAKELLNFCLSGVRTTKNILLTFVLIGILTALWRASGCLATLVVYATAFVRPWIFLLFTFLMNCLVSLLTGTAFGAAATMGVISMSLASTLGLSPMWVGGTILAGVFFGDRCSPVSTSALLVATLTETNLYENIKAMIKSANVPFFVSCLLYLGIGFLLKPQGQIQDAGSVLRAAFVLSPVCLLPAAVILVSAVFKVPVKKAMFFSILTALPLAFFIQKMPAQSVLHTMIFGYQCSNEKAAVLMNGGGLFSMARVAAIVCISSCYSGLFQATGLLSFLEAIIQKIDKKWGSYRATLLTSIPVSAISCNQTLSIILTHQLTKSISKDPKQHALNLENTAVVVAPMIPWSIASTVALLSVGAPVSSILCAFFLYLLPLWRWFREKEQK